MKAQWAGVRE